MQSKSEGTSKIETSPHDFSQPILCPEPWWRSASYNPVSSAVTRGTHSNSSSLDHLKDDHSESEDLVDEEVEAVNDSQTVTDGKEWGEHHNFQNEAPTLLPRNEGNLMQPPQLELAGTVSLNSYPYPYVDPYYGGVMAAYGTQQLVPPHFVDMHNNNRMPLPLDVEQEPVFVNAKQYHGILRRRQSRAKMELQRKMIKNRKPYLHESRHQHAMRRARSTGGRFAKKPSNTTTTTTDPPEEIAEQSNSANSSGSSHSVTTRNSSHHKRKAPSPQEETTTTTNNNHFRASPAGKRGKLLLHPMNDEPEPDRKSS